LKRLVIKRGEQIQRREIGSTSLTVGRDPSCEIHIDDPSLSRRHGMFEPTAAGVRFVDLGSRNGSWVNFQKMKEAELKPGDTVRMGSLLITYAYDAPPPPPTPKPPPMQNAPPPAVESTADDSATVLLAPKDLSKDAKIEPKPEAKADAEGTVLLSRETAKPKDTGTMLFRSEAPPKAKAPDTARLSVGMPPPAPAPPPVAPAPSAVEGEVSIDDTPPKGSWTGRHALIVLGVALTVYLVLALPLVRTLGNALREESLRRGRALLNLLTATNAAAVAEGRSRDLEVEMVTREERVKEALILDLQGKVLAPSSRVDESFKTLDGIQPNLEEIRTFYLGRRRNGDYVMVEPLLDRGRRIGIAVLVYEVATASGSWAVAVLFLAFLVLMVAVLVAVVMAKRFTLEPIAAIRDDVEAVVKGDAPRVPLAQGFSELSEIAKSVNRLIERAPALAPRTPTVRVAAPEPPAPRIAAGSTRIEGRETPIPRPAPPAGAPAPPGDGASLWVDAGFIVIRAEPQAAALLGAPPEALVGRHVIEAIKDETVLVAVLDSLNALDDSPGTVSTVDTPTGPLSISATREGDGVLVSLKQGV
jgi:HAMP domain-containing protein